jgi:Fe-S cluster assembly protein SufD
MENLDTLDTLIQRIENKLQTQPLMLFLNGQCILRNSDFLLNLTEQELHITIPKNRAVQKPFHIIHIIDTPKSMIKTRIYLLENAHATIFETYYVQGSVQTPIESFSAHANTDVYLSHATNLQHYVFCESGTTETLIHNLSINQQQSEYTGSVLQSSLGHQQTEITLNLHQPEAVANLQALCLASETQMKSLNLITHHHAQKCNSRTQVRGIANGKAKHHFTGTIVVHPKASQSEAHLEIKQLLLSEQAEVHAKPELEIHNDEVQCTHGATVGHLDTEALFYLTTRGIPEAEAKKLLIQAFMHPILEHMPSHECLLHNFQKAHGY